MVWKASKRAAPPVGEGSSAASRSAVTESPPGRAPLRLLRRSSAPIMRGCRSARRSRFDQAGVGCAGRQALQGSEAAGASLPFLPPYSPDFNPIEMAFSKLKAHVRKAAARTVDALDAAVATALKTFHPHECENFFAHAGYDRD